jgi:hypothetical protein
MTVTNSNASQMNSKTGDHEPCPHHRKLPKPLWRVVQKSKAKQLNYIPIISA